MNELDEAKTHRDTANTLWREGRWREALDELQHAINKDPDCPNAYNLAGWIYMSELREAPGALEHAVRLFEEAHTRFPDDHVALINLGDALLASGRAEDAVAIMEAAGARESTVGQAMNWLGWYCLEHLGVPDRALTVLDHAASVLGWWGPVHQNRGRALDELGNVKEAMRAYERAIQCGDAHDPPFIWHRIAHLAAAMGCVRRALSACRRAVLEEVLRGGARVAEMGAAEELLQGECNAQGKYYPHASDELAWMHKSMVRAKDEAYRPSTAVVRRARKKVRAILQRKADLPEHVHATLHRALEATERLDLAVLRPGEPFFELANEVTDAELRTSLEAALHAWSKIHRSLYTLELDIDEPAPWLYITSHAATYRTLAKLIADEEHDRAIEYISELDPSDLDVRLACVDLVESAGDRAHTKMQLARARAYYEHALEAYRWYASTATAGAEGMARMPDVHRLEQKLKSL